MPSFISNRRVEELAGFTRIYYESETAVADDLLPLAMEGLRPIADYVNLTITII